jgi:Ca2+-binding RTX toxin-like protein
VNFDGGPAPATPGAHGGVSVNLATGWFSVEGYMAPGDGYLYQRTVSGSINDVENVYGTRLDDTISGDEEANTFIGYFGDDHLSGAGGNDVLDGGVGHDTLDGGEGSDTASYGLDANGFWGVEVSLEAGIASRMYNGVQYIDTLISIENVTGSNSADVIEGNTGANTLDGGGGNDILDGAGGNDFLIGGAGADEFLFGLEFHFQESHVTVADFAAGLDQLNLSHLDGIDTFEDALDHFSQQGANAVFAYADSTITLEGVQVSALTAADFLL